MSWTPPGLPQQTIFSPGIHEECILAEFAEAKPSKDGRYIIAYIATYRDVKNGAEIDDWIRFDGSKRDYYSGLRMERLHAIIGAELGDKINVKELMELSNGIVFGVEAEQNGQYINVTNIFGDADRATF